MFFTIKKSYIDAKISELSLKRWIHNINYYLPNHLSKLV